MSEDNIRSNDCASENDSGEIEQNVLVSLTLSPSQQLFTVPPQPRRSRSRRGVSRSRSSEFDKLSSVFSRRLRDASTVLLDRLFEFLAKCPDPNNEAEHGSQSRGLTLPAAAIGWLSFHLYPDDELDLEEEEERRDWWMDNSVAQRLSLIRFLLPRATHLRVTGEEWPPPNRKEKSRKMNKALSRSIRRQEDQSAADEEEVDVNDLYDTNRPFLRYIYLLRNRPRVDMRLFPRLSVLFLDGIPPEWVTNMEVVQDKLELLRLDRGCLYDLPSFLFSTPISVSDNRQDTDELLMPLELAGVRSESSEVYTKLSHLKLTNCCIGELSGLNSRQRLVGSMAFNSKRPGALSSNGLHFENNLTHIPPLSRLTNLVSLSLAHNDLVRSSTALAGLASLPLLSKVDLSFNRLTGLEDAFLLLGNVEVLLLSGNLIETTKGIDRLYSLRQLSLDNNRITDLSDVAGLARLPEIAALDLRGNILAQKNPKKYRVDLLNLFRECRFSSLSRGATYRQLLQILPILDGERASRKELVALRYLTFKQSILNPIQSGTEDAFGDIKETEVSEVSGDLSASPIEPDRGLVRNHIRVEDPSPSVLATPQYHIRRVRRRSKSRRAIIENASSARTKRMAPTTKEGNLVLPSRRSASINGRVRKVNFGLEDVIAIMPKSYSTPIRIEDLKEEATEMPDESIEEEQELLQSEKFSCSHDGSARGFEDQVVSIVLNNSEVISDKELHSVLFSTDQTNVETTSAGANLSLLSISTVKSQTESVSESLDVDERLNEELIHEADLLLEESRISPEDSQVSAKLNEPRDESVGEYEDAVTETSNESENKASSRVDSAFGTPMSQEAPEEDGKTIGRVLQQISFPENIWDTESPSAGAERRNGLQQRNSQEATISPKSEKISWGQKYKAAETNSAYDGPEGYKGLNVLVNLELYFRCFVFPGLSNEHGWLAEGLLDEQAETKSDTMPRIQLYGQDRDLYFGESCDARPREHFRHVWNEEVVACGKSATTRLSPNRIPRRGFHGDILFADGKLATVSECRKLIFCSSDAALYLVLDHDTVTAQAERKLKRRQFPMPIPQEALFQNAPWPHAVSRHPIASLNRITIGFGFQRLILHFSAKNCGYGDFVYVLLTSNKLRTISLLQQIQDHVKEAKASTIDNLDTDDALIIDNDDKQVLDALTVAVAPTVVGIVLHYQVLQQRWKHGDRGSVRRACVVTDTRIFLLDEDYVGDASPGSHNDDVNDGNVGNVSFQEVESAELDQVVEVIAADADPRSITIVIKPVSRLQRTHRWRLICRDGEGAERLVDDVRKAIASE